MYNFNELVDNILLEVETDPTAEPTQEEKEAAANIVKNSDWFKDIKNRHDTVKYGKIDENLANNIISTALLPRPSEADIQKIIGGIRVFDVLWRVLNTRESRTSKVSFIKSANFENAGKTEANRINSLQPEKWVVESPDIRKQYEKIKGTLDKQASIALDTYNNLSILEGVIQIVKRRTDILSRVMNLKSVTQPFANVITDIFKSPEQYLSGQKAVSTDFSEMVDKLYASDIINIAVAAKDFYASEMASLKMGNQEKGTTQDKENAQLTGNAMGDSIDNSQFNKVVLKELGVIDTLKQKAQSAVKSAKLITDPKLKQRFDNFKKIAKQNTEAYINFISNKPVQYKLVDETGKETGTVESTIPGAYTLGKIKNIETPEAIALISALRGIAQYDRTKPGVAQRMAGAQQALQGIASFAGAKLYT